MNNNRFLEWLKQKCQRTCPSADEAVNTFEQQGGQML